MLLSYSDNRRGARRGRQRGSRHHGNYGRSTDGQSLSASPLQSAPVGDILDIISPDALLATRDKKSHLHITGCDFAASYSWEKKKDGASILIPGIPPRWNPASEPRKLPEDAGTYYRDLNAASFPDHPIQPAVEAILAMHKDSSSIISTGPVDLFACGSTLGNIIRFVQGERKPFRILVEVIGQTVHLIRRESSPFDTIPDVRGYGHTFPEANTMWDSSVKNSYSHQRVIHYRFGHLHCLVRYEVDGYLPSKSECPKRPPDAEKEDKETAFENCLELMHLSFAQPGKSASFIQKSEAGWLVPQSAIFDLKTRSIKRKADEKTMLQLQLLRLWVRQIPSLILGYHDRGQFDDVEILDVRPAVRDWEDNNQADIRKFAQILDTVIKAARSREDSKLELVYEGGESLDVREQAPGVRPALPAQVKKKWSDWLSGEGLPSDGAGVAGVYTKPGGNGGLNEETRVAENQHGGKDQPDLYEPSTPQATQKAEGLDYTACDEECDYCGTCNQ